MPRSSILVALLASLWAASCAEIEERSHRDDPREPSRQRVDATGLERADVYGHSRTTLYRFNPESRDVSVVGDFSGCSNSVLDIALDRDSNMFGTTGHGLYRIDRKTAVCTVIARGNFPNSLSFLPAGTLDPKVEALVGYEYSQYVRIDPETGSVRTVGALDAPGLKSSGDIVSAKGGSTFLTVKGSGCDTDCLIEVDPRTGAMRKNWGALGHVDVYGIAFWGGRVYGFSDAGDLFEVQLSRGGMRTVQVGRPGNTSFWGAGSTTSAPIVVVSAEAPVAVLSGEAPEPEPAEETAKH